MLKRLTLLLMLVCFYAEAQNQSVLTTPRKSEGREEMRPHIGALIGLSNPNDDYGTNLQYGIDVGFQPIIPFSLSMEISRVQTESSDSIDKDLDRVNLLAKANYNFGGNIPVIKNSFVGAALGPIFDNYEGVTYVRLGTGLNLGADFPITSAETMQDVWSIGANVGYLLVSDTDTDTLNVAGVVKYWY
jgi:hypothetical protein